MEGHTTSAQRLLLSFLTICVGLTFGSLQAKNLVECTTITTCTETTSLCTTCYSPLSDSQSVAGLVAAADTHLYRFTLCDGQTPFNVMLTTHYGNADIKVWNQPNVDLVPNYISVAHLDPTQKLQIGSDLGIRTYTIGVVNAGLFGASYSLVATTGTREWNRGVVFPHSVNEGCSQYYTHSIDSQRGTPYMGVKPDQVQVYVEGRSQTGPWPTPVADWEFDIFSYYNVLKRPEIIAGLIPNATNGIVGTQRPGRGLGYTVNGERAVSGYCANCANEFTLLSSDPEYKIGNYYTAIRLKQGSAGQKSGCTMGYSIGGDLLFSTSSAVHECTSSAQCSGDSDISTASNWGCTGNVCTYKGVALRSFVGDCATYCGTAAALAMLTCTPLNTCRMAANDTFGIGLATGTQNLGGGDLVGTYCSNSHDCKSTSYITDSMFQCDTYGEKSQSGGSGQCMFAFDGVSFQPIEGFPVGFCYKNSECREAWIRAGLNCAGPKIASVVREIKEISYSTPMSDNIPYGTTKYYQIDRCNPNTPIDIQFASSVKAFADIYISNSLMMNDLAKAATHCSGGKCTCKLYRFNDPSAGLESFYRIPGTTCNDHTTCKSLQPSRFKCGVSNTLCDTASCCFYCTYGNFSNCNMAATGWETRLQRITGAVTDANPNGRTLQCTNDASCVAYLKTTMVGGTYPTETEARCVVQTAASPALPLGDGESGKCKMSAFFGGGFLQDTMCTTDSDCSKLDDSFFTCNSANSRCQFSATVAEHPIDIPSWKNYVCSINAGDTKINSCRTALIKNSISCYKKTTDVKKVDFESKSYCSTPSGFDKGAGVRLPNTECSADCSQGTCSCRDQNYLSLERFRCNLQTLSCEYNANPETEEWTYLDAVCSQDSDCRVTLRQSLECAGYTGTCTAGYAYGDGTLWKVGTVSNPTQNVRCSTDANCQATSGEASIDAAYLRCNKRYGNRCELLTAEASSDSDKDAASTDDKSVPIAWWTKASTTTYPTLGYCESNSECYSAEALAARRCEKRFCRVSRKWGGGPLPFTSCTRTSDCVGQLSRAKWRCVVASSSTPDLNYKGTCQFSGDGQTFGVGNYIHGWKDSGFSCFNNEDCRGEAMADEVFCDGDERLIPNGDMTSTTLYVAVSPKRRWSYITNKWQDTNSSDAQLTLEFFDGTSRANNEQVANYNQQLVAPVCYTDPPAVSSGGQEINIYGRNFFRLHKETLALGGLAHYINLGDGMIEPRKSKWKLQPRCVFRTEPKFAMCKNSDGVVLQGTTCTQDVHCQVNLVGDSYEWKVGSLIHPFSNIFCQKEDTNPASTGLCSFSPSYCPLTGTSTYCMPPSFIQWETTCTDTAYAAQCFAKMTAATCDSDYAPRCRVSGYSGGSNGQLPDSQCVVSSDCRKIDVSSMICEGGACKYDSDISDGIGQAIAIPGPVGCSASSQCVALISTLECVPEKLRTDATMLSDEHLQCQAPPNSYAGTKPVFVGMELEVLVDVSSTAEPEFVNTNPPMLARSYSVKKRITGASPAPPPLTSVTCDPNCDYNVQGNLDYFQPDQTILQITPPLGPVSGQTSIVIRGENFYDTFVGGAWVETRNHNVFFSGAGSFVQVGEYNVSGTGTNELTLTTQAMQAGIYVFRVAVNSRDYSFSAPFEYLFYNNPNISMIYPSSGTAAGGTLITIYGSNFPYDDVNGSSYTRCRFKLGSAPNTADDVLVSTAYASAVVPLDGNNDFIVCSTPQASSPSLVSVELTFNLQQYTSLGYEYQYTGHTSTQGTCFYDPSGYSSRACGTSSECRYNAANEKTLNHCIGSAYCKASSTNGGGNLLGSDCTKALDCENLPASDFKCVSGACQFGMFDDHTAIPFWTGTCTNDAQCATMNAKSRTCSIDQGICRTGKNYGGGVLINSHCSKDSDCFPSIEGLPDGATVFWSKLECKLQNNPCQYYSYSIPRLQEYGGSSLTTCQNDMDCKLGAFAAAFWCDAKEVVTSVYPQYGPDLGGTVVTINGNGFKAARNLKCQFGLTPSCIDTTTSCVDWARAGWCQSRPEFMKVQCCHTCGNDHMTVFATWISTSQLLCVSPNRTLVGQNATTDPLTESVELEVTQNNLAFTNQNISFFYYSSKIDVSRILPPLGPVLGNTRVEVWGSRYINTMRLQPIIKCKFGHLIVAGTWNDTSQNVICFSPANGNTTAAYSYTKLMGEGFETVYVGEKWYGHSGGYPLELSFDDGNHWTTSNVLFHYLGDDIPRLPSEHPDSTRVTALNPHFGPRTGNTTVSIIGSNFHLRYTKDPGLWRIKFGSEYVPVDGYGEANISSTYVLCTTHPESMVPSYYTPFKRFPYEIPVEVTVNDQQFTQDDVRYTYYEIPWVLNILPTQGPAYGGTSVTIYGGDRAQLSLCGDPAKATECTRAQHLFLNIGPAWCRFGSQPPQVSTFVQTGTLDVLNYTNSTSGANTTKAYQSGYHVCTTPNSITPLSWTPASVIVDVAQNQQQFTGLAATPLPFVLNAYPLNTYTYFRVPVTLYSLFPSNGPTSGGTLVTITGYNFTQSNEITCKFGEYRSGFFYQPRLSIAEWLSSTKVRCTAPRGNETFNWAIQRTETVMTVNTAFDLSMNTQEYTSFNVPYIYSLPVTNFSIYSILPNVGPGATCCTIITISGVNFQDTGEITCKFAAEFSSLAVQQSYYSGCTGADESCDPVAQTPATWINTSVITCPTPRFTAAQWAGMSTRIIDVDVSLNGQNYRRDDATLTQYAYRSMTFYDINKPLNCTPVNGPAAGGTTVEIIVESAQPVDYSALATCRWDGKYVTKARNVRLTRVFTCETPTEESGLLTRFLPSMVPLEIAYNGQNYEPAYVNFTFYSANLIESITPAEGLTAADYGVTIVGNNFEGSDRYFVRWVRPAGEPDSAGVITDPGSDTYSPKVVKTTPTTLVANPPLKQSTGVYNLFISLNNQNWIDSCQLVIGETSDHIISIGTCSKFTFIEDPICYTCQSPNKPVPLGGAASITPSLTLYIFVLIALLSLFNH